MKNHLTTVEKARARRLRGKGYAYSYIAEKMGRSINTIRRAAESKEVEPLKIKPRIGFLVEHSLKSLRLFKAYLNAGKSPKPYTVLRDLIQRDTGKKPTRFAVDMLLRQWLATQPQDSPLVIAHKAIDCYFRNYQGNKGALVKGADLWQLAKDATALWHLGEPIDDPAWAAAFKKINTEEVSDGREKI